jgi:hypothetical protein
MRCANFLVILAGLLLVSCNPTERDLNRALLEATTTDAAIGVAKKCEKLETKGLPIFIKTLDVLSGEQLRLDNYGKISVCLDSLRNLASKGISSKDEAEFLVQFIQKQRLITDTLVTAEILKSITGYDVGYDKKFIEHYTQDDESKRKQMIREWERAIEEKWKEASGK